MVQRNSNFTILVVINRRPQQLPAPGIPDCLGFTPALPVLLPQSADLSLATRDPEIPLQQEVGNLAQVFDESLRILVDDGSTPQMFASSLRID
jgi:hypothetical protein